MLVIMSTYGSHQPEAFNALEPKASLLLPTLNLMKSSKNVDQLHIDCDSLRSSLQSMMFFIYLNSRNVSEFQPRLLNNKKSLWSQIFLMSNILSEYWIRKRERGTNRKAVKMYKIQWTHRTEEEATWETEDYLNRHFPGFLSSSSGTFVYVMFHSSNLGMRFLLRG